MSIKSDINELNQINLEIKTLTDRVKNLKKLSKEVEKRIINYLNEKNQPGIKYNGSAVIVESKSRVIRKGENAKKQDAIRVLRNNGVSDPEHILNELTEAQKGSKIGLQKIKINKIK